MDTGKFTKQGAIRGPWRAYLDGLAEHRSDLHRYCLRLTGNVWDGEDLMQDTLARVFALLGRTDTRLENPRAYLIRTATNIWIDHMRRSAREQATLAHESREEEGILPDDRAELRDAARRLFTALHPQERAAILMKDVFDLSLEETARLLGTSVGAVKDALSRGRGRLDKRRPAAGFETPPRALVERFMKALAAKDLAAMQALCAADLTVELVGGAQTDGFENNRNFFKFAHMTMPRLGFGLNPRWEIAEFQGESVVIGFRTLNDTEGLNEVHRLEAGDDKVQRVRCYCFCPETLAVVAHELGCTALSRPYRSASLAEFALAMIGLARPRGLPRG